MNLREIINKNIHIVGASGTEGSAVFFWLNKIGAKNITLHDYAERKHFKQNFFLFQEDISKEKKERLYEKFKQAKKINCKNNYLQGIEKAELVFLPTSYFRYRQNKKIEELIKKNKKIEFKTWYNLILENYNGTIIGVTGTAGKGTVTNLIISICKQAKRKAYLVGDSWKHVDLDEVFKGGRKDLLVVEANNRYLKSASWSRLSPKIAVLTNITSNHLDDHGGSFAEYKNIKAEIFRYQKNSGVLIYNRDDESSDNLSRLANGKKISYSAEKKADFFLKEDFLTKKGSKIVRIKELKIFGPHMVSNALAAAAVADCVKISPSIIRKGLIAFKGRHMRMEYAGMLRGRKIINDSASTRPEATIRAVQSFKPGSVNLILGGRRIKPDKEQHLKLVKGLMLAKVRSVALIGEISRMYDKLFQQIKPAFSYQNCASMSQAVAFVLNCSKKGDVILMSPGAESFGRYRNYRERSDDFIRAVRSIKK